MPGNIKIYVTVPDLHRCTTGAAADFEDLECEASAESRTIKNTIVFCMKKRYNRFYIQMLGGCPVSARFLWGFTAAGIKNPSAIERRILLWNL